VQATRRIRSAITPTAAKPTRSSSSEEIGGAPRSGATCAFLTSPSCEAESAIIRVATSRATVEACACVTDGASRANTENRVSFSHRADDGVRPTRADTGNHI
jgi:hypothetical protein